MSDVLRTNPVPMVNKTTNKDELFNKSLKHDFRGIQDIQVESLQLEIQSVK